MSDRLRQAARHYMTLWYADSYTSPWSHDGRAEDRIAATVVRWAAKGQSQ